MEKSCRDCKHYGESSDGFFCHRHNRYFIFDTPCGWWEPKPRDLSHPARACWNCTYHQNIKTPHTCLLHGRETSDVACCDAWTGRRLFQIDEDMKAGLWHDWSER